MAWIMKNSATMTVDRRDEPYLDDAFKAKFEADAAQYATRSHTEHNHPGPGHGAQAASAPSPADGEVVEYTCPMHPEIVQIPESSYLKGAILQVV